jgi:hypothetical protein
VIRRAGSTLILALAAVVTAGAFAFVLKAASLLWPR